MGLGLEWSTSSEEQVAGIAVLLSELIRSGTPCERALYLVLDSWPTRLGRQLRPRQGETSTEALSRASRDDEENLPLLYLATAYWLSGGREPAELVAGLAILSRRLRGDLAGTQAVMRRSG